MEIQDGFIVDVYNYCDRWCEACPLTSRCRLFADVAEIEASLDPALKPVADQFYGDRSGTLEDTFGHMWTLATHKEDVAPEEIQRRFEAFSKQRSHT